MTVAADGRLYVGRDLADRTFKVVLVDEEES